MNSSDDQSNLVSVIIPTFNRREVLDRAIRSVLNQSCKPLEVIVVDDGSMDGTHSMMDEFPQVRYLPLKENHGVSYARNRGVEASRGLWLAFLDSDDEWLPNKLERQLEALQSAETLRACYTDEIWIRRGVRVNPRNRHRKYSGRIFRHCLELCLISPSSILMDRDLWDSLGGFDESFPACEDYDLWLRLTLHNEVLFLEEPLIVKYGGHEDQLSRKYWGMDRFRVRALEKILNDPSLQNPERLWVLEALAEKCRILKTGYRNRGKLEEASEFEEAERNYRECLQLETTSENEANLAITRKSG